MYCGNCGKQLSQSARFCGHCGAPVPESAKAPQAATNAPQSNRSPNIAVMANGTAPGINSGLAASRGNSIAPMARAMPPQNANSDWAVTLDLEESCSLLRTGWFASEVTFHIRPDGLIWVETVPQDLFELLDFAWDGPNVKQKVVTVGNHKHEKKGRLGGAIAAGATAAGVVRIFGGPVGGLAAGAVGAVVGAFAGNGDYEDSGKEITKTDTEEHDSIADVTLRSVYTGQIGTVTVTGKSRKFSPLIKLSKYMGN